MHALSLLIRLSIYYAVVGMALYIAQTLYPNLIDYLPVGGAQDLIANGNINGLNDVEIASTQVRSMSDSLIWLSAAIAGAFLTILPVSWTYVHCRHEGEYDQSLVETIIMLPLIVTSIVVIVHNSLALAFSLAGIVGAVRFRNTLKSSGDALYVFIAIGVGLAGGVGALEIAVILTVTMSYGFGLLWLTDYGGRQGTRRYMRDPADIAKEKRIEEEGPEPELRTTKKGKPKKTPLMKARLRRRK